MNYPTREEIESADLSQLKQWVQYLPIPGSRWLELSDADYDRIVRLESLAYLRIKTRIEILSK